MRSSNPPDGPLRGVTVVEVDTDVQAQFAGHVLLQLGADVTLLEPSGGSALRRLPPFADDDAGEARSVPFEYLASGKRTVALGQQAGTGALAEATASADMVLLDAARWLGCERSLTTPVVVVHSLYGMSPDPCRALAPSSPFTRYHAGGDGYFLPTTPDPGLRPTVPGYLVGESIAGIGLAIAALHGLARHRATGAQQVVDFSQQAYNVTMNKMFVSQSSYYGTDLNRATNSYPFGGNLECADGYVAVLVLETHQWRGLCQMLGATEWLADERYRDGVARRKNGSGIDQRLRAWCTERSTEEVIEAGRTYDVPIGLVARPRDVLANPGLRRRGFVALSDTAFGRFETLGLPFGGRPVPPGTSPPGPAPENDRPYDPAQPEPAAAVTEAVTHLGGAPSDSRLEGLKVLDLTWAGAGPIITWTLGAMGCDVAKVEHPDRPDLMRRANRTYGWSEDDDLDGSPSFNEMNAGKKSVVIDLRTAAGRAVALELAAQADVVCESMRPGRVEALGLGYEAVRAVNPTVVYASLSATGRGTSQTADLPGYAPVFWAMGGGAWLTGWPDAQPDYVRSPVDMHAGSFACLGILAALQDGRSTGRGAYVDLSAIEAVAATIGDVLLGTAIGLRPASRRGNDSPPWVLNDTYPCAGTDQWVAVSLADWGQWPDLARTLGLPGEPPAGPAGSASAWMTIANATRARDAAELEVALQEAGVAASRVNSLRQLLHDDGLLKRGYWDDVEHPVLTPQRLSGLSWIVESDGPHRSTRAPLLDEHTDEVLTGWLGMDRQRLAALKADRSVVGSHPTAATAG